MRQIVRSSVAAALALSATAAAAAAGDWPWREQVQLSASDTDVLWVRVGEALPARRDALWREQVLRHELPLLITVPARASAPQSAMMWREQVVAPALGEVRPTPLRMSGGIRGDEGMRRQ
jgi:hypothetical protein